MCIAECNTGPLKVDIRRRESTSYRVAVHNPPCLCRALLSSHLKTNRPRAYQHVDLEIARLEDIITTACTVVIASSSRAVSGSARWPPERHHPYLGVLIRRHVSSSRPQAPTLARPQIHCVPCYPRKLNTATISASAPFRSVGLMHGAKLVL